MTLCDGNSQSLFQSLFGVVSRQVKLIETSMRLGQLMRVMALVDGNPLQSVHALQLRKPSCRDPRGSGDKLDQLCQLILGVAFDNFPVPLDDWVCGLIP